MAEAVSGGSERMMGAAPEWIGAVFEQGNRRNQVIDYYTREILVPVYNVSEAEGRRSWVFENMRVFLDGTVASPEGKWKPVVDEWLSELRFASNRAGLGRVELKETESDLKAIMAVCSSARAMEVSAGAASTYLTYVTLSEGGRNLDVQDTWADYLLHNDPNKLKRVVGRDNEKGEDTSGFPLVRYYYDAIVNDAGIKLDENVNSKGYRIDIDSVDRERALRSDLVKYFASNKPEGADESWKKQNSFDEYIADVLLGKETDEFKEQWGSDSYRWTCAKIAADAFLVNLYTQWEYQIDREGDLRMMPVPTWGGDPFRAVIEPSFLPNRVKSMYESREDSVIHYLTDKTFRPDDILEDRTISETVRNFLRGKFLKPSATTHLKAYARYSNALWEFLGSSRGKGIPSWDRKMMGESLSSIVEYLDQVYGAIRPGPKDRGVPENIGKHLMGLITTRLIHTKALAVAMETSKPGFKGHLTTIFGDEKSRPFLEVRQFLYGPLLDVKDGFFEDLAGARTRFIFDDKNVLYRDLERKWTETWEILISNDQTPEGRRQSRNMNTIGFIVDSLTAISQTRRRG